MASLRHLGEDETLIVQSGKPVGVFPSPPDAPLVLMACGNVVGHYATPEYFDELCDRGLIMWGGLTAGDWQYIGFQGVLQGVYELLQAVGEGALRRVARGKVRPHRGPRRHGLGTAARHRDGGRQRDRGRGGPGKSATGPSGAVTSRS